MNRKYIAQTTLEALEKGAYRTAHDQLISLATDQRAAQTTSRLYRPTEANDLLGEFDQPAGPPARVRVYQATTLHAAAALATGNGRVGCLNFASARNPGGGFLKGSQAQEESLARSSGLYPCLTQFREMYAHNALPGSTGLYSDYLIYSPQVPVIRSDDGDWLTEPFLLDILTAPAVNAGALQRNNPDLLPQLVPTMQQRIRLVLAVAARHGIDTLILGAWGCGVFANDPAQIAQLFAEALAEPNIRGRFRRIDFAIFDPTPPHSVLQAFEQALPEVKLAN
ncbi:MAG: TIGR02452 family protein [Janthinobacterium lividum]